MFVFTNEPIEGAPGLEWFLFSNVRDLAKLPLARNTRAWLKETFDNDKVDVFELTEGKRRIIVQKTTADFVSPAECEKLRILGMTAFKKSKQLKTDSVQLIALGKNQGLFFVCEGWLLSAYSFNKYLKAKETETDLTLSVPGLHDAEFQELKAIQEAVYFSRDLINEPVIHLSASELADRIRLKGLECGFGVEILSKKKIESLKMGGLLAVNYGSVDPPSFSILEYKPNHHTNVKPLVLVGKGVVYDTGGLSLKPTPGSMDSMKSDMSGAAAVAGAFIMASRMNLPLHIIGLIPATDNRPGGNAYTPGDIITMMDGTTVEVLNTDAEGRMILADALHYAKKYDPELVINLATLTGAASVAIGKNGVVAMGNAHQKEMKALEEAGHKVHERLAVFPFWDDYKELLKSPIADLKNIGGREAGAITAGKFLEHFTNYPFIHLDIAGPAFLDGDDKYRLRGGTGVGVRLLYEFLKKRS